MSERELSDWLSSYVRFTQNSEPPTSYHTWAGLSLIAGALQRKVFLRWGFEEIYPNLYVVLVGPAGRCRKGVALGIAKNLLVNVPGVSVAPESSSGREALVQVMKRAAKDLVDAETGQVSMHCSLTAFSEELSVFLGQSDVKYLANLTDWYDSKAHWEYETIGRGKDSLEGLCFNLLGATAPDWIQSMLPQEAIGGGFTSRIIFIVEEQKGKTVPKHQLTPTELALGDSLQRDLERISQLKGPFEFTPSGETSYCDWYAEQDRRIARGDMPVADRRFAAYCERRATHVRKMMMLCSASRGDSLEISHEDFDRAISMLERAELKMGMTFGGLGKARNSDITEQVMRYIQAVGVTTRSAVMSRFYRDIDQDGLRNIEATLEQMHFIEITLIPKSNDKKYVLCSNEGY